MGKRLKQNLWFFVLLSACAYGDSACSGDLLAPAGEALSSPARKQYETYLRDTARGLNALRGDNGLIQDTVFLQRNEKGFTLRPYKSEAAPSDIALDLLAQTSLGARDEYRTNAFQTLERTIDLLNTLEFHSETGLFFRLYSTQKNSAPVDRDVSSVDNGHLAIALWTVSQFFPDAAFGRKALRLFERMDFSSFFDSEKKLIGGNLKFHGNRWELESYRFHFGSEARSLYTAGYALGLFKKVPTEAWEASFTKVPVEFSENASGKHLLVWDGGIFQALLPTLLIAEEIYSPSLKSHAEGVRLILQKTGPEIVAQGKKLRLPAAYSAASTHVVEKEGYLDIFYSGKLGHPLLKSSQNPDAILSTVIAPHAVLLAAGVAPLSLASSLKEMEEHISGVYYPNFGWVDSLTVFEGSAIPNSVGVGVDKAMELIALLKILDPQGLSPSAKAFYKNAEVRRKLAHAYAAIFPDRFTRK